jgi:hypothetical protein
VIGDFGFVIDDLRLGIIGLGLFNFIAFAETALVIVA